MQFEVPIIALLFISWYPTNISRYPTNFKLFFSICHTLCVSLFQNHFCMSSSKTYFHIPFLLSQLQTTANVTVNGRQVPVTNMSITDATGQIDVALWRDISAAPIAINSTYSFTHMTSSMYNSRPRLCSTRHTTVTVSLISQNISSVIPI